MAQKLKLLEKKQLISRYFEDEPEKFLIFDYQKKNASINVLRLLKNIVKIVQVKKLQFENVCL